MPLTPRLSRRSVNIEIDFPVWRAYAAQNGIHSAILSYLSAKPQNFYYIEEARGERDFVTARGWEDLSVFIKAYERENYEITADVVEEYIHCEKIAGDFAAYYQMFSTYQREYRPSALLQGELKESERAAQEELFAKAAPDEQYSVLQMMLSVLYDRLHIYRKKEALLKRKQEAGEQLADLSKRESELDLDTLMKKWMEQYERAIRVKKEHRLFSEAELQREEQVSRYFESCYYRFRQQRVTECVQGLAMLKEQFGEEKHAMDLEAEEVLKMLDRGFEFLENSVGEGEKLGYFMTALVVNEDIEIFLGEHMCVKYLEHLELLNVSDEEEELRKQVKALQKTE